MEAMWLARQSPNDSELASLHATERPGRFTSGNRRAADITRHLLKAPKCLAAPFSYLHALVCAPQLLSSLYNGLQDLPVTYSRLLLLHPPYICIPRNPNYHFPCSATLPPVVPWSDPWPAVSRGRSCSSHPEKSVGHQWCADPGPTRV